MNESLIQSNSKPITMKKVASNNTPVNNRSVKQMKRHLPTSSSAPIPPTAGPPPTTKPPLKRIRPNPVNEKLQLPAGAVPTSSVKSSKVKSSKSKSKIKVESKLTTTSGTTNTKPSSQATTTATAPAAAVPTQPTPNIYDAMLGEISDLLSAAQEAQSCGRLKMASTYQLLVHTRLVGLGKRFDRFLSNDRSRIIRKKKEDTSAVAKSESNKNAVFTKKPAAQTSVGQQPSQQENTNSIRTAQAALAKILPSEVHIDYTMMEHLSRAAMELHNKRTGKGMLHEKEMERKMLAQQRNAATAAMTMKSPVNNSTQGMKSPDASNTSSVVGTPSSSSTMNGVAWSPSEKHACKQAISLYGYDNTPKIAEFIRTRSEAEVKAHIKNINGRKRIESHLDSSANAATSKVGSTTVASASGVNAKGGTASNSPETKRKGRGKKPPTRAMLTVPNTTFDAKRMLYEPI